jgi:hypothetical protein
MTVGELMKRLESVNQNIEVVIEMEGDGHDYEYMSSLLVSVKENGGELLLSDF